MIFPHGVLSFDRAKVLILKKKKDSFWWRSSPVVVWAAGESFCGEQRVNKISILPVAA